MSEPESWSTLASWRNCVWRPEAKRCTCSLFETQIFAPFPLVFLSSLSPFYILRPILYIYIICIKLIRHRTWARQSELRGAPCLRVVVDQEIESGLSFKPKRTVDCTSWTFRSQRNTGECALEWLGVGNRCLQNGEQTENGGILVKHLALVIFTYVEERLRSCCRQVEGSLPLHRQAGVSLGSSHLLQHASGGHVGWGARGPQSQYESQGKTCLWEFPLWRSGVRIQRQQLRLPWRLRFHPQPPAQCVQGSGIAAAVAQVTAVAQIPSLVLEHPYARMRPLKEKLSAFGPDTDMVWTLSQLYWVWLEFQKVPNGGLRFPLH